MVGKWVMTPIGYAIVLSISSYGIVTVEYPGGAKQRWAMRDLAIAA